MIEKPSGNEIKFTSNQSRWGRNEEAKRVLSLFVALATNLILTPSSNHAHCTHPLPLSNMMAADITDSPSQTEVLLEVSQPSPDAKQNSIVRDEVVEDSLKDNPEAYRGGAVKSPQAPLSEEEDDLYSESPKAKARRVSRSGDSAKTEVAAPSTNTARQERLASDLGKGMQGCASQKKSQTPWQPRTALEDGRCSRSCDCSWTLTEPQIKSTN